MSVDTRVVRQLFSRIAPYYDFLNHVLSLNSDRGWRKKVVNTVEAAEDSKILDLCTGTGEFAIEFARTCRACRVYGVDFSREMLKRAGEKIKKAGLEGQINLVESDVFALPFRPGSFDIVSIGFGLRNLVDYPAGISVMAQMLKKGGKIVILEFSPPADTVFGGLHLFYLKNILPLVAGICGGSCEAYRYLSVSISGFASPRQVLDQMKLSGLINVRHLSMRCGLVNVYYGEK